MGDQYTKWDKKDHVSPSACQAEYSPLIQACHAISHFIWPALPTCTENAASPWTKLELTNYSILEWYSFFLYIKDAQPLPRLFWTDSPGTSVPKSGEEGEDQFPENNLISGRHWRSFTLVSDIWHQGDISKRSHVSDVQLLPRLCWRDSSVTVVMKSHSLYMTIWRSALKKVNKVEVRY